MACQAAGGQALAVPTNTTNEAAVTELARRAVERFGRMTRPSNGRLVAEDDGLDEHQSPDTDQQSPVWSGLAVLVGGLPAGGPFWGENRVWSPADVVALWSPCEAVS
jgi:hypothetical protein